MKKLISLNKLVLTLIISCSFINQLLAKKDHNPFADSKVLLQFQAGPYPTFWTKRDHVFLQACDCSVDSLVLATDEGRLAEFDDLFKLPFIVGMQISGSPLKYTDLYAELNYIQAGKKRHPVNILDSSDSALTLKFGNYRAVSSYFGIRFYTPRKIYNTTSFFIGGKLGLIYRGNIIARQSSATEALLSSCTCASSPSKWDFFKHATRFSGGGNVGIDIRCKKDLSIVLTGEFVISKGPQGNGCIVRSEGDVVEFSGDSAIAINKIGTEFSIFPTLGFKYRF